MVARGEGAVQELENWDWQAGFAELGARFGPARGAGRLGAGAAADAAVRALELRRDRAEVLATRALPVWVADLDLGDLAGAVAGAAWVVLILARRAPDLALAPGDPLRGFPGDALVLQALVRDDPPEFLVGNAVPVNLRPAGGA